MLLELWLAGVAAAAAAVVNATRNNYDNPSPEILKELKLYAGYSSIAYCIPKGRLKHGQLDEACPNTACLNGEENQTVTHFFEHDVAGLVMRDDDRKEIVVMFKGTTTDAEWKLDFDIELQQYTPYIVQQGMNQRQFNCDDCRVHSGFYKSIKPFMKHVMPLLLETAPKYPDYQFTFTGHSLGGAIAPLVANEAFLLGLDARVIAFAGPKIGNKEMSEWMDQAWNTDSVVDSLEAGASSVPPNSFIRVTASGDFVPLVPPGKTTFSHSGCELLLLKGYPSSNQDVAIRGKWTRSIEMQELRHFSKKLLSIVYSGKVDSKIARSRLAERHAKYLVPITKCEHDSI